MMQMQRKEFSEKVGFTERQVLRYCELGIFNPNRPEGAPNNRRYFSEKDIKIAEVVHLLRKLNYEPVDIERIFKSCDGNLEQVLELALRELKLRIRHDQNLVFAVETVQTWGTSMFSFGDMSDEQIDKLADAIRKSKEYKHAKKQLRLLDEQEHRELALMLEELVGKMVAFINTDSDAPFNASGFENIYEPIIQFASKYSTILGCSIETVELTMGFLYLTEDGSLALDANRKWGEDAAISACVCFLFAWLRSVSRVMFPLVSLISSKSLSKKAENNVVRELYELFASMMSYESNFAEAIDPTFSDNPIFVLMDFAFELSADMDSDPDFLQILDIGEIPIPTADDFEAASLAIKKYESQLEKE